MDQFSSFRDTVNILDAPSIRELVPMASAIRLMEVAFPILSAGDAFVPQRVVVSNQEESMSVFFKPAFLSLYQRMSIKILTQILDNTNPENPTIKGLVLLIDMATGKILSISDGRSLTAIRTGAASGIATQYLSNPAAQSVAIFGCGAQGQTQLEAVMAVRRIKQVLLFDVCPAQADGLASKISIDHNIACEVNPGIDALRGIDVICTATPSQQPLFGFRHLKPGVHINAIGSYRTDMQEIDPEIMRHGSVFLDDAAACLNGSGDLTIPIASGAISEQDIRGELGELIAGKIAGRHSSEEITIFKSVGNGIQDFFIANEAYEKSIEMPYIQKIELNG